MPELPEVETMRRRLAPDLIGRRIERVVVRRPDIVGYPAPARFRAGLAGRQVAALDRRGKYLLLELDSGDRLILHMRLSGHLELVAKPEKLRYERLRLELDDGRALAFVEPRVLGKAYLVRSDSYPPVLTGLMAMGPEPGSAGWGADHLRKCLAGRRAPVKSLLLDQKVCCGVGNIYSDEALFRAGIRPQRPAGKLTHEEIVRLARSLSRVIADGVKWCGTTMPDQRYLQPDGGTGEFQKRLRVFGQSGQPCVVCGTTIRRDRIGNRSTHYCPKCQK